MVKVTKGRETVKLETVGLSGVSVFREWSRREDWDGLPGDVFRKHHMEVSRRNGGKVTWWRER